jgi:hypothetical protein
MKKKRSTKKSIQMRKGIVEEKEVVEYREDEQGDIVGRDGGGGE